MKTPSRKFFITKCSPRRRNGGSVLLITLGFILLITVISVAFLVRSRSSLQTSQSYSREMIAKEVGEIGINTIAAQFQKEIKDAAPAQLLLPPRPTDSIAGQNPRESSLIRVTTNSTISSNATAKNGWTFGDARWKAPALLTDAQYNAQAQLKVPEWVYVDDQGITTTPSKNIIGRFAAMVYDVGGLLDINEAGSRLALGDKGSVAFADLSAFTGGTGWPDSFRGWHGGNATLDDYYGNSTITDPKLAGRIASPISKLSNRENRFFSRMELIEAAKPGNNLGLTPDMLPKFRTRSEAANRLTVENLFAYGTNSTIALAHADLKATKNIDCKFTYNGTDVSVVRIDGSTESPYTIKVGEPLFKSRFPLARLRWLADREADGTPKHKEEIKQYFGLTWDTAKKLFIYTSPDQSTAVDQIKTLKDLASQINGSGPVREPDFFEWLKAGINPDTLGQTGGSANRQFPYFGAAGTARVPWEASKDLHLLRIGANIIDQSDPDSIPTCIRSQLADVPGVGPIEPNPFDSFGVENIPYLNEVIASARRENESGTHYMKGYLQFEMWNPNRNATSGAMPPRDYAGGDLTQFRVRATEGRVYMEPFVYVEATNPQVTPLVYYYQTGTPKKWTKDKTNGAWSNLEGIREYSQRDFTPADFDSPNLAGVTVDFGMPSSGDFFREPYLANGPSGQDTTGAPTATGNMFSANLLPIRLGAEPTPGVNAMRVSTVKLQSIYGIDAGTKLRDFYRYKNQTPPPDPDSGKILPLPAAAPFPTGVPPLYTTAGLGAKAFNAVVFCSEGWGDYNIQSEPVTFAIEVRDGSGTWHTCQIYNSLAMNTREDDSYGRQAGIKCGDTKTTRQNQWTQSSETTSSCFGNWLEWQARKGFHNTDPRTERFGLTDNLFCSAGMSSRVKPDEGNFSTTAWFGDQGMTNKIGTSFTSSGATSNEPPAPRWGVLGSAPKVSVTADLALNIDPGQSLDAGVVWAAPATGNTYHHCYADYDSKVRPADARWVPTTAHPALPVATYPDAKESRPIILDRPFRNVAELGCVFRDIPWKSLDLFTPDQTSDPDSGSPDRRLLDIFSIEDRATVTGKINPNLATKETLHALLMETSLDPSSSNDPVPPTTANATAKIFSDLTISDPIHNSANMTARLSKDSVTKPDGGFSPYKAQAENFIRALSSTTDTRSWQLMLDVVAQSGRVVPPDGALTNFVVEGQKRFFVYLTIDRITGEIVDKHVEPVYE